MTAWAEKKGISATPCELINDPKVKAMIKESINTHLKHKFGGYEIPKEIILADECFSVENGLLTQTLKLKRRKVLERYRDLIEAAYAPAN